jgi:hypothetical protein
MAMAFILNDEVCGAQAISRMNTKQNQVAAFALIYGQK